MAAKQKILVTGSNGQLGSELKDLSLSYPSFDFYFFSRTDFPLENSNLIIQKISELQPQYLINCAAYTAVDKAETEKKEAFQINGTAVGVMAETCAKQNIKFVHISTDYVFDGSSRTPLQENAPLSPVNYYGESKLAGEQLATQKNRESIIIRTSWVYSFYGKNFVKTMMRLMSERESVSVVNDQWGSPTYAADLAIVIMQIIGRGNWQPGIYHFSNEGLITWADLASAIAALLKTSCTVNSIPTTSFPTPAKRPSYSVMDKSKIQNNYGIELKPWKESLQECIRRLESK